MLPSSIKHSSNWSARWSPACDRSSLRNAIVRQPKLEDMMYYTTKFRFLAKPNCKPNLKFSKKARTKTRYETHKTGWYLDFRAVLTPSLKHEIPNLVFNLVSLEKKFGAIVSWVLNIRLQVVHRPLLNIQLAYDINFDVLLGPRRNDLATPTGIWRSERNRKTEDVLKRK